jgi:hypothetical protein
MTLHGTLSFLRVPSILAFGIDRLIGYNTEFAFRGETHVLPLFVRGKWLDRTSDRILNS